MSSDEDEFSTKKPINGGTSYAPVNSYSSFDPKDSQLLFPVRSDSGTLLTSQNREQESKKDTPMPPVVEVQYTSSRKPMSPSDNSDLFLRYKYYNRLSTPGVTHFRIPDHVLPKELFVLPIQSGEKQSSIVTIFSIWNTMIGSSLLSIPWAINEAGWLLGIGLALFMCFVCLYGVILILRYDQGNGINGKVVEFADLAEMYFGKYGSYLCLVSSVGILWGAAFAYCILMSGFLFNVGDTITQWTIGKTIGETVVGPYWTAEYIAIGMMIAIFPLTLAKDFGIIAKLTSVGTISVIYLILFVAFWAGKQGLVYGDASLANSRFYYFTGILTLSFFIHNAILNIMRNQKNPKNNARDASIAYVLVFLSYTFVGVLFYFTVEKKSNINQNFLENIKELEPKSVGLFISQFLLLFQMVTVFPLLAFIIRFQTFNFFYKNPYPKFTSVMAIHLSLSGTCILIGVFFADSISAVLRFTGAIFGMLSVYLLPIGFHLKEQKINGTLTWPSLIFHSSLILFGVANLIAQFI